MIKLKENKTYLVTGGSGFLGVPLIERILNANANVVTVARDEGKLIELKQKFPDIKILTGDMCYDRDWETPRNPEPPVTK